MKSHSIPGVIFLCLALTVLSFGQIAQTGSRAAEVTDDPALGTCSWSAAAAYPINIADNAVATVGANLYSFAGVSNSVNTANSYRFDGTSWTPIAPLPVAVQKPGITTDGTFIYITGGITGASVIPNTLYRYDPTTNTYATLAPMTTAVWNHAMIYSGGKLYKFGGSIDNTGTNNTNVLEIYDIATNTWTTGAPYPVNTGWLMATTIFGKIYGGGGIAPGTVVTNKTFVYDPVANSWSDAAVADLPAARWSSASDNYGTTWVVAGGADTGFATVNTTYSWDPYTNVWTTLPVMPLGKYRVGGSVLNNSFYTIGGNAFTGTTDVQRLNCLVATAANVSIEGRVTDGKGNPIGRAMVTITDSQGAVRSVKTNTFGIYRIEGIAAGGTYILQASAKGYAFDPQVMNISDNLSEVNFTAQ